MTLSVYTYDNAIYIYYTPIFKTQQIEEYVKLRYILAEFNGMWEKYVISLASLWLIMRGWGYGVSKLFNE